MKFKLYREHGALNSPPVFTAIEHGLRKIGHTLVSSSEDVAVIWSALWAGRMLPNQKIYESRKNSGKPTIFVEIGNLKRGQTWRISVDHVNGLGLFGNKVDLDTARPEKLGIRLNDFRENRRPEILIACQHARSLQWAGMPSMEQWAMDTARTIRQYSDRPIIVRPHPRHQFRVNAKSLKLETPKKIIDTYDDFDIDYGYHCVINHNSGPAVHAGINGIPLICDYSSLASAISMRIDQIESPYLPDRQQWFLELTHTEWTIPEIEEGIPFLRLDTDLKNYF